MDDIVIVSAADFHLGHHKTKSLTITNSLRQYLLPEIVKADVVFLVGDIFDTIVTMSSLSSSHIISFFIDLFSLAAENNTIIRILRGTISHDRNQLERLRTLYQKLPIHGDIKFINIPSIEVLPSGHSVLYLPDDLPYKNKGDLFDHIDNLLLPIPNHKVDYVVCHGTFDFTAYGYVSIDHYTVDDFKDICSKYVLCGHIHKPQRRGNVIYSGSFDRLAHNEEHKKGFWVIDKEPRFIENLDTIKYITKSLKSDDVEMLLTEHDDNVRGIFKDDEYGFMRIRHSNVQMRQVLRKHHDASYPHIKLTFDKKKGKNKANVFDIKQVDITEVTLEKPTIGNINKILSNHIREEYTKDIPIERIDAILKE